jgi:hypothetical protein
MKKNIKILFIVLFSSVAGFVKAGNSVSHSYKTSSDSTINAKSNIIIFKMLYAAPNTNSNESLKKAGKVARKSNSHSSILKLKPVSIQG